MYNIRFETSKKPPSVGINPTGHLYNRAEIESFDKPMVSDNRSLKRRQWFHSGDKSREIVIDRDDATMLAQCSAVERGNVVVGFCPLPAGQEVYIGARTRKQGHGRFQAGRELSCVQQWARLQQCSPPSPWLLWLINCRPLC